MVKLVNRARMTTATTGTGAITLGSAVTKYQTFAAAGVVNGDVVSYTIEDGNDWETGTGTYTSAGTTLSRTLGQSSTGALLSLSGTAEVFVTALAADIAGSVLLATQTTTSGATQTISVGNLSAYRQLYIVYVGISNTSGATRQPTIDGISFGASGNTAATTYDGWMQLDLATGYYYGTGGSSAPSLASFANQTSYSRASTSIVFGWSGTGNWDAGTIYVYGVT